MRQTGLLISFILLFVSHTIWAQEKNTLETHIFEVKSSQSGMYEQRLLEQNAKLGGYLVQQTRHGNQSRLTIRVPRGEQSKQILDMVKSWQFQIKYAQELDDRRREMLNLQTDVETGQRHYEKLVGLMQNAGLENSLELEREMLEVISKLEQARGRMQFIEKRSQWVELRISFFMTEAVQKKRTAELKIPWLRSLSLSGFLENF